MSWLRACECMHRVRDIGPIWTPLVWLEGPVWCRSQDEGVITRISGKEAARVAEDMASRGQGVVGIINPPDDRDAGVRE